MSKKYIKKSELKSNLNELSCKYRVDFNISKINFSLNPTLDLERSLVTFLQEKNYVRASDYAVMFNGCAVTLIGSKVEEKYKGNILEFMVAKEVSKKAFELGYKPSQYNKIQTKTSIEMIVKGFKIDNERLLILNMLNNIVPDIVAAKKTGITEEELKTYYSEINKTEKNKPRLGIFSSDTKLDIVNTLKEEDLCDFNSLSKELTLKFNNLMRAGGRRSNIISDSNVIENILDVHFKELKDFKFN